MLNLPWGINLLIFEKLHDSALKSLGYTNKFYYNFIQKHKVWKTRALSHFENEFKELPEPLAEPRWIKVYYHVRMMDRLRKKFTFQRVKVGEYHSNNFLKKGTSTAYLNQDRIFGIMMKFGSKWDGFGRIGLSGLYENYPFKILAYNNRKLKIKTSISPDTRLYDTLVKDLQTFLFNQEPVYHDTDSSRWSRMHDLFHSEIPNWAEYQRYEYYHVPDLTFDCLQPDVSPYLKEKFIPLEKHEIRCKSFPNFYNMAVRGFAFEKILLGNYHGTPFILYSEKCSLILKVPCENPAPLIEILDGLF